MFAKPKGRATLRKLTLSEWVNLVSAIATTAAAVFAFFSVLAANSQVRVALEVVSRGERLKNISEFSVAAREACRAIIPPQLNNHIHVYAGSLRIGEVPKASLTYFETSGPYSDIEIKKFKKENERNLLIKFSEMLFKSRSTMIWLESEIQRIDLSEFVTKLYNKSLSGAINPERDAKTAIGETYANCENAVASKISELIR